MKLKSVSSSASSTNLLIPSYKMFQRKNAQVCVILHTRKENFTCRVNKIYCQIFLIKLQS